MSANEIKEDVPAVEITGQELSPQQKAAITRKANSARTVEIGDEPDATVAAGSVAVTAKNHDDQLSGKKVRVTFHAQEGEDGDKPIFSSLNGYAYQIPRDVVVAIPVELLEVFANAKSDLLSTAQGGEVRKRTTNRFQYSVHG